MRILSALVFLVLVFVTTAHAGSPEENFDRAIQLSAAGKGAASAAAMRNATADLWLKSPLSFATAVFVDKAGTNYGMFHPRPSNVFKKDEKLRVYAEPIGYAWQKIGDLYSTNLVVDAALLAQGGKVLWSKKSFGVFKLASRRRFMEYMMNLTLSISGIPPGNYIVQYTVSDKIGGNNARIKLPFAVQ
jgi:hypothetical protein